MIWVVHPGSRIRMLTFSVSPIPDPGSRGQKGTQSRIPDPDPQRWWQAQPPNHNFNFLLTGKEYGTLFFHISAQYIICTTKKPQETMLLDRRWATHAVLKIVWCDFQ
jgi:hypothetical protein